jgi:ATP-dependent phosphoenolpyruvate carboxykinase
MGSTTSIDLSLEDKELVILGTEYAGEMKKGVFTVANYFALKRGVLSMYCSATADKQTRASSLLFGLSGTGKKPLFPLIQSAISSAMMSTAGAMTEFSISRAAAMLR